MLGICLALMSTASWAISSLLFKRLGKHIEPYCLVMIESFICSIFLCLIALFFTKDSFYVAQKDLIPIALSGIIGISIGDSFMFASLKRLSPVVLSSFSFICPVIFSGIFGMLFLNEIPSSRSLIGILFTLCGILFFIFPVDKKSSNNKTTLIGIIFAMLAAICSSYSMVLIKPVLNNVPVIVATMYRMFFCAIVVFTFVLLSRKLHLLKNKFNDLDYNLKLLGTIFLVSFGGFYLSLLALKYCMVVILSVINTFEPVFVFIIAVLLFRHKPKLKEVFGISLVILGIIIILHLNNI